MIASTPPAPYYAVIFTSIRTEGDNGYNEMGEKMLKIASVQPGFLGVESARNEIGITISYWKDLDSIRNWKLHTEHTLAQEKGKAIWYKLYNVRIAKVEKEYGFENS